MAPGAQIPEKLFSFLMSGVLLVAISFLSVLLLAEKYTIETSVINLSFSPCGVSFHAPLACGALGATLIFLVCLLCSEVLHNVWNVLSKSASMSFLLLCYFAAPMGM